MLGVAFVQGGGWWSSACVGAGLEKEVATTATRGGDLEGKGFWTRRGGVEEAPCLAKL